MKKLTFYLFSVILAASVFISLWSCSKDDKPSPPVVPPSNLKLGDSYQGGIIFYLDASGQHGLIAATADQSRLTSWWNGSFVSTGASSTTDGAGNTTKIIQAQGNSGNYAAKICRDYKGGGYTDWFLPSKDQLNTLYTQKNLVGGFGDEIYWSSTEFSTGEAWVQYFQNGLQHLDNTSDGATVGTRAIRAF
jgi:hypothetical protein